MPTNNTFRIKNGVSATTATFTSLILGTSTAITSISQLIGAQGAQGAQGLAGAQGSQGYQGDIGAQGSQGAQGDVGAQGAQGDQGAQGAQGAQGDIGAQGDVGAQGAQGAQGDIGAQGDVGAQGSQGDVGAQGAQGDVGAQGSQGEAANFAAVGENIIPTTNTTYDIGSASGEYFRAAFLGWLNLEAAGGPGGLEQLGTLSVNDGSSWDPAGDGQPHVNFYNGSAWIQLDSTATVISTADKVVIGQTAGDPSAGVLIGPEAGNAATGNVVAIGKAAGKYIDGQELTAVGNGALENFGNATSGGSGNTALGYSAGNALTEGEYNTLLGHNAAEGETFLERTFVVRAGDERLRITNTTATINTNILLENDGSGNRIHMAVANFTPLTAEPTYLQGTLAVSDGTTWDPHGDGISHLNYYDSAWEQVIISNSEPTLSSVTLTNVLNLLPLTAEPTYAAGTIAVADGSTWDPVSLTTSTPYLVFHNGVEWRRLD